MSEKFTLTEEGLKNLQDELYQLKNVERVKNITALQEARAQGDLSENADYDAARDQQAQIAARIATIEKILKNYEIIKDGANNLGKWVIIEFLDLEDEDLFGDCTFKLISSAELLNGKKEDNEDNAKTISNESPLGSVLMKAKVGDVVQVNSDVMSYSIKIVSIL